MKIIQVTPQIGKNDLARKMKQAQCFLEKREQVRITLVVKGRQKGHISSSLQFLNEIHEEFFAECGKLVKSPTAENLSLMYNPSSRNK